MVMYDESDEGYLIILCNSFCKSEIVVKCKVKIKLKNWFIFLNTADTFVLLLTCYHISERQDAP